MFMGAAVAALAPAALLTTAVATPAAAQDYTSGAVAGSVVDSSGNPVSGATVTITSRDRGFTRSATTTSAGTYRFSGLSVGEYDVTATSGGQSQTREGVRVSQSSTSGVNLQLGTGDTLVVTGTQQNLDFKNTTTGVSLDVTALTAEIPVGRDLTSLTLLAPGTTLGDDGFGNLSSLGGSSVAENAYYLNGLNITDFNNYTGSSLVPFEFYQSVDVKTGGYPAEFGRATGGVVNAVTKSGSNDFMAAIHLNYEPDALRSDAPNTYARANHLDERRRFDAVLEVGGPIVEDRLFFYSLVEINDNITKNAGLLSGTQVVDTQKSPFFGIKVDAIPIDDHHFEFTYFDTARTVTRTSYDYDSTDDTFGTAPIGLTNFDLGGESFVGKYTGNWTEWLTVSVAYGKNNDRNELRPQFGSAALPYSVDLTDTGAACGFFALCNGQTTTTEDFPQYTSREFWRADADLFFNLLGDHHIRIGYDQEKNNLVHSDTRTGGGDFARAYIYRTCGAATLRCMGATVPLAVGDDYVEINHRTVGGSFDAKNVAFYFQDEWNVTERLTLNLGVRLDQFNNFTANGSQFIDFNSLWAPRGGFSYDVFGDGRGRLYGSYGWYYLPVAGNTGYRQGAQEYYFREYWTYTGVDGNGIPTLDQQLVNFPSGDACPYGLEPGSAGAGSISCNVTGDGTVQDPTASISRNLRATREHEIIVGYEHQLTDLWTVGVNYTHRNLAVTAEDVAVDAAIIRYCEAEGITGCSSIWTGYHQYTLINPGADSTIVFADPLPGEMEQRTVDFSAAELGYPLARRSYDAVEFTFQRASDGVWNLQGSYTWSESKGNSEGFVQSDFEQDDAGITQDYDQPEFTEYSYGLLPNHRRHRIKVWGSYNVTDNLLFGTQIQVNSPRPLSCFGYHPLAQIDDTGPGGVPDGVPEPYNNYANGYGAGSHYCGGEPAPRGTGNQTDWIFQVDTSIRYNMELPGGQGVTLRADVFNLFNASGAVQLRETGEQTEGAFDDPYYGQPTAYQEPRYVRFGVDIGF